MENLVIKATKDSPAIKFNARTNILDIEGESYMENAPEFYKPVIDWLKKFLKINNNKTINFNLKLEYFNTSSVRMFVMIFEMLEEAAEETEKNININWYYNPENDIDLDYIKYFKEELQLSFNMIEL